MKFDTLPAAERRRPQERLRISESFGLSDEYDSGIIEEDDVQCDDRRRPVCASNSDSKTPELEDTHGFSVDKKQTANFRSY